MFVRFRRQYRRLNVSLVATRRIDGKVKTEHVAALGSVPDAEPAPTKDRVAFYRGLKERLDRLMNRIDADQRRAIVAAVVAKIPVPDKDEITAMQLAQAEDDAVFWRGCAKDFGDGGFAAAMDQMVLAKAKERVEGNAAFAGFAEHGVALAEKQISQIKRGETPDSIDDETRARMRGTGIAFYVKAAKGLFRG
jgi:hypothetical protein